DLDWNDAGVEGAFRFLKRVWALLRDVPVSDTVESQEGKRFRNKTIKKVTEDLTRFQFNTGIAALMEYYNFLDSHREDLTGEVRKILALLLSPFVPHFAEELWRQLGHSKSLLTESWPSYDETALKADKVTLVFQINGKVRGKAELPPD